MIYCMYINTETLVARFPNNMKAYGEDPQWCIRGQDLSVVVGGGVIVVTTTVDIRNS